ncbi:SIR2 family protein [Ochrobactrum sp. BD67]
MDISELPDFPAIQQIQDSLWQKGDVRGAAVMVGAGFSRMALRNTELTPYPPLWDNFSDAMKQKLYPHGASPDDPLRLAQEYKAALGEVAIDGLIRSLIRDDQWQPGEMHQALLSLPWADVLTTNWDTLLERTELLDTERAYEVVRTVDDIARTRSPRIVKLHGSFPANKPFIFTEEDYRTYPKRFAPFVNLAQQVLLENELCLIGFSGDDPNFLQWAGWVRDHLGDSSRQVRLVGVLELSPSRREMLKQQNVTAIDLAPLVTNQPRDVKHSIALSHFLEALLAAKPRDIRQWNRPSSKQLKTNSGTADTNPTLEEIIESWRQDRENHPGWLVTPGSIQAACRYETDRHYSLPQASEVNPFERMSFLFELAWRHETCFWPLSRSYRDAIRQEYLQGHAGYLTRAEQVRLCTFLTAECRRDEDHEGFEFWISTLKSFDDQVATVEAVYNRALNARREFDYETMEKLAPQIIGDDPIWKLRQGMIYSFLRDEEVSADCIHSALVEVKKRRTKDRDSIWLLSREAWALWIYHSAQHVLRSRNLKQPYIGDWPTRFSIKNCDPWEYISYTDRLASEAFQKLHKERVRKTPGFNAGDYRDSSNTTYFVNHANVSTLDIFIRLQETVGIPSSLAYTNLLKTRLSSSMEAEWASGRQSISLTSTLIHNAKEGLIDTAFNRIEIANMDISDVHVLVDRIKIYVTYFTNRGNSKNTFEYIEEIKVGIEILSRLSVRLSVDLAKELYNWTIDWISEQKNIHWTLFKNLENLLERALEAIPRHAKAELAETALFLPLPGDISNGGLERDWPELISKFEANDIARPTNNLRWSERIAQLINAVRSGDSLNRSRALMRLRLLYQAHALTDDENSELASAIWQKSDNDQSWPECTGLLPHIFLQLPEDKPGKSIDIFGFKVVNVISNGNLHADTLLTLHGGVIISNEIVNSFKDKFIFIFRSCLNWNKKTEKSPLFWNNSKLENDNMRFAISNTLSSAILPEMSAEDFTAEDKQLWGQKLMMDGQIVATAYEYSRIFPDKLQDAVRAIRKSIYSKDAPTIGSGLFAVRCFAKAARESNVTVPELLVSDIISACETMKEPHLYYNIGTARELLISKSIDRDGIDRLIEGVSVIWSDYSYDIQSDDEQRNISLTLTRRECVRIANIIYENYSDSDLMKRIIDVSIYDPMPEVRYA